MGAPFFQKTTAWTARGQGAKRCFRRGERERVKNAGNESGSQRRGWRTLAWNGVEIPTPYDWEPVRLEKYYLLARGQDSLALECKWQQGKSVSQRTALKRLTKALKGVDLEMDTKGQPPAVRQAFKELKGRGFDVKAFNWKRGDEHTVGALLRCGVCGRTTLLQCVGMREKDEDAALAADLLAGFADHREDGGAAFDLFGIRAVAPAGFTLKNFSFKPGQYRLEFEGDKSRKAAGLVLERVGPASVLFAGVGFAEWATERFAHMGGGGELEHGAWQGGDAILWRPRETGALGTLWRRLSRRRLAHVRAWLPAKANMVLCVALVGGGRRARDVFEEVCASYALAQESQASAP